MGDRTTRPDSDVGASSPEVTVGDRIVVHGHHVGEHDRIGEILEVRGAGATRSFLVRWDDDGHRSIIWPGTDVSVHHYVHGTTD